MNGSDAFGVTLVLGNSGNFSATPVTLEVNGQPLTTVTVPRAAVTGRTLTQLAAGASGIVDRRESVDVQLSNSQAQLFHADTDALAMGANAMLIGAELIQFGRATQLGQGAYRLTELIRGCRGSEHAMSAHVPDEPIVMLDPAYLLHVPMNPATVGAQVIARAYAIGDDEADPPSANIVVSGESLRALSPCHVRIRSDAEGVALQWIPRRTQAFAWSTDAEEPGVRFTVTARRGDKLSAGKSVRLRSSGRFPNCWRWGEVSPSCSKSSSRAHFRLARS